MATIRGSVSINASLSQDLTNSPLDASGNPSSVAVPISASVRPTPGTAADQVDLKYTKRLTFAVSTPQVLDLTALLDVEGNAVNFARVTSIVIKPYGLIDGATLKLGYSGVTANAWTSLISNPGQVTLRAFPTSKGDAFFAIASPGATGWAVGPTNKLLNLDPGANAYSVDIEITGRSA